MARRRLQHRHLQLGGPRPSEQERLPPRPHEAPPRRVALWLPLQRTTGGRIHSLPGPPHQGVGRTSPPTPPGGPRGGTFWPLPAPGGFRRPTRTKSRAQLQDLESPGRVTAVSVCLHLYVASLPLGQMSVWAPCSRALVTSGPSITQGLPPTLASFVTPANTLLLRNFTFTGSWGWDPLSSGATSRLSRLSRSPTKAGPWNPRLTKSQTLNVPCSAAIFQFNWLEMDLAGRDVPGNGWV